MTIVCPKCMHKSDDDERVCAKCGAMLLSAAHRRGFVRAPDDAGDPARALSSTVTPGPAASASVGISDLAKSSDKKSNDKIATNGDAAGAIRDALEYLESSGGKSKPQIKYSGQGATPTRDDKPRRIDEKWLATIVITFLAVIAVSLFFGLSGSSPSATKGGGTTNSTTPTLIFEYSGSGTSTTGSFIANGPFTFTYKLSCQPALTTPATFVLLKDNTKVDQVASAQAGTSVNGTHTDFGASGTYRISVDAPTSCTWTLSGLT